MAKTHGKARKISLRAVAVTIAPDAPALAFSYTKQLCDLVSADAKTAAEVMKAIKVMDRLEQAGDGQDVLLDDATWEVLCKAINGLAMQNGLIPPLARAYGELFTHVLEAPAVEITEAPAATSAG